MDITRPASSLTIYEDAVLRAMHGLLANPEITEFAKRQASSPDRVISAMAVQSASITLQMMAESEEHARLLALRMKPNN